VKEKRETPYKKKPAECSPSAREGKKKERKRAERSLVHGTIRGGERECNTVFGAGGGKKRLMLL